VVLLVDPDHEARAALAAALSPQFDVHEASDGATALGIATTILPVLVITELVLPHLDGPTLARCVRSRPALQRTAIVFLSSQSSARAIACAVASGARRHIVKPCSPTTVAEIAARIVGL
jgi:PleD family two-component response regulator